MLPSYERSHSAKPIKSCNLQGALKHVVSFWCSSHVVDLHDVLTKVANATSPGYWCDLKLGVFKLAAGCVKSATSPERRNDFVNKTCWCSSKALHDKHARSYPTPCNAKLKQNGT